MEKKIPQRKCLGCLTTKPKKELIRIVKTKDGEVHLDKLSKINGRGAYFCNTKECLEKAIKSHRIEKEFEIMISNEIYERIKNEFNS